MRNIINNRFSIKNKIFFLFVLVITVSVSIVGWFGFVSAKDAYISSALNLNKGKSEALVSKITGILETIPSDLLYNKNLYALKNLIIWTELGEKEQISKWRKIYTTTLKDYIVNKKFFYQIRYIDANGNEKIVLKYDSKLNKITEINNDLQNKSNRNYFNKAIGLKKGEFYISQMNLNMEHNQVERPYVPVVRYSTPIINENGETKGVIVLNFNANNILKLLEQGDKKVEKNSQGKSDIHLINKDGYYLYHDKQQKCWGFQLDNNDNFFLEFQDLKEKFIGHDSKIIIKDKDIFIFNKIYPDKINNPLRYWYMVSIVNKNLALASLSTFMNIFAAILVSVLLFGFLIINGYISKLMNPLLKITSSLKALSKGEIKKEDIDYSANDEMGDIVKSTTILVDAIETTINQANAVANGNFTKDIELLSKNDRLGLAITDMTNRLIEITNLAKNLSVGNYDTKVIAKSSEDELGLVLIDMVKYLEGITQVAESIAFGEIDVKYKAKGSDDRLGIAILQMIKYLQTIVKQAKAITNEDFNSSIESKGKNDELGNALISMTDILMINSVKNKDEIWFSEGLGEFSDKLIGIDDTIALSKKAISICSRYVGASSGVIYTFNKEEEELNLVASFSFTSRDTLSNKFSLGEGVIGQVALEKESILLKNIKDGDFEVQSGITLSKPKEIFAFPLIHDGELFGVTEVMSFDGFTKLQKEYLLKTANIFVATLHTTSQNIQIKNLLEESQRAFEELQTKSEEMQVQSEELRASNEQMEEQQRQLETQSANLKIQNVEIEKAKVEIDKRADDLEASNQYKSEFLANMSHELRTPLNSVILLSSLLSKNSKDNLNESDIQKASVINESGNELLRLINDILDLSKIESGKMELIIDEINTTDLLKSYNEIFSHTAKDKGLEFNVIDNIDGVFYNDKDRLGQIIRNLISNAIKFTKEGSVTLQLDKTGDEKLPIKVSVIDTGLGIPEDKQELIFKAFTQADGSTSRQFGGTGLGLSITKELTHLMKGEVKLESIEGEGAIFSIHLPSLKERFKGSDLKVQNERISIKSSAEIINKKEGPIIVNEQFLIIEDDKNFANILKNTVEEHGSKAFVAYTGKDGLEIATQHKIDGAIIDIGLPDISGMEVIKKLKANPITKNIHIQVISGKDKELQDFGDIKIDGYLQKPVSSEQINNAISNIENLENKSSKSILIVEDNELHLKAITDYIQEENNYEISTANSVNEAIKLSDEKYFDIAIVDLGLGDGSGSEVCRYLTKNKEDTAILIYTGRDLTNDEADFLNDISDEIIIKNPNSHERLKDEVERFLSTPHTTVNEKFKMHIKEVNCQGGNINVLKSKNVLIVDDDIKNIFVLSSALQEHDMNISHAKNGQEALDFLKENIDTDIVLMDIMMPIMNGYEAMKAIRVDDKLKHLPIIAVTAKAMEKDKQAALKSGADDYLTKPIDLEKLSSMIAMWINKEC